MKKLTLYAILFISNYSAFSQSTILQDQSGKGTIALGANQVSFNVGDASATGGIGAAHSLGGRKKFWDATIKFKSTNGIASLLAGYKIKPTVDIGFDYGWGKDLHSWYIAAKLSTVFYNLLKTDNSNTFVNGSFLGPSVSFGYNFIGQAAIGGSSSSGYLIGTSISLACINNLSDLKSVDVYQTVTDTATTPNTTLLQGKKSGYSGDFHSSFAVQYNLDAFIFPAFLGSQIGVGGYARAQIFGFQPRQNAGVGFILGAKGAPANIAFGILYQFNDIFNQLDKENDFLKRGGINIVAGYKF